MRARHLFSEKSDSPREKSRGRGHIVQMKTCTEDVIQMMVDHPLFKDCSRAECEALCEALKIRVKCFSEREVVASEVAAARDLFAVCSGGLHAQTCGLADGSRHLVQSLGAGETFGAGLPMMDFSHYPAMLLGRTKGVLLRVDVQAARRLVLAGTHLNFVANLYAETARQGYRDMRKLTLLSCHGIADRLLLYLRWRREDGLLDPVVANYTELAAALGVNRTALYRAVDALKLSGKIRQIGARIVVAATTERIDMS